MLPEQSIYTSMPSCYSAFLCKELLKNKNNLKKQTQPIKHPLVEFLQSFWVFYLSIQLSLAEKFTQHLS